MTRIRTTLFSSLILIALIGQARIVYAQVTISEIMYNPTGADAGHEWVEVINEGSADVDLTQCKFLEVGTTTSNHGLTAVQGGALLAPGSRAIIADNAQTFLSDHVAFTGVIVDSSFSLNNTGETIAFKIPDGTISDTVSYTKDMGAYEDGNSLQRVGGVWRGEVPTPGTASFNSVNVQQETPVTTSTVLSSVATQGSSSFPVEPQIFADAGVSVRTVSVGAPVLFTGRAFGLKKEPIENARMVWSFGDGGRAEGITVSHTYYYPGDYITILDVASGYYSASDRTMVHVSAPLLSLSVGGDTSHSFITLENRAGDEVDLSEWQIESAEKIFILPKNTILGARKSLIFASEITGLITPEGSIALLRFPNGSLVETQKDTSRIAVSTSMIPVVSNNLATPAKPAPKVVLSQVASSRVASQEAVVSNAISDTESVALSSGDVPVNNLWLWYVGAVTMGVIALFAVRAVKKKDEIDSSIADFEIIEEEEPR